MPDFKGNQWVGKERFPTNRGAHNALKNWRLVHGKTPVIDDEDETDEQR